MVHPLADVKTSNIGEGTTIWQYAIVLAGATIGKNCNLNCHTFVENDVVIGNDVTVKAGVYLWDGITVDDKVFIGPSVAFTNDKYPRSKQYPNSFQRTVLMEGCSIGANATILGGITIGKFAIIGAGSVVTKDVPAFALVMGNPARFTAWIDEKGNKLTKLVSGNYANIQGDEFIVSTDRLMKL